MPKGRTQSQIKRACKSFRVRRVSAISYGGPLSLPIAKHRLNLGHPFGSSDLRLTFIRIAPMFGSDIPEPIIYTAVAQWHFGFESVSAILCENPLPRQLPKSWLSASCWISPRRIQWPMFYHCIPIYGSDQRSQNTIKPSLKKYRVRKCFDEFMWQPIVSADRELPT